MKKIKLAAPLFTLRHCHEPGGLDHRLDTWRKKTVDELGAL